MEALRQRAPRALHVAEICGRMGVAKSRRDEVLDVLDELVSLSLVSEMPGHRFRMRKHAPAKKPPEHRPEDHGTVVGRLGLTTRGFGFVSPEDGSEDVFIPPNAAGAALHGDRVIVQARPSPKGREGRVREVLSRRPRRITGTLRKNRKGAWIDPDDVRLRGPIPVTGELPKLPKKKGRDSELAVIAELVRFPQGDDDVPEARVIEPLGVQGMTAVEVAKIKIRENVVEEFDDVVRAEAEAFPDRVLKSEKQGREDLRKIDLVTIDPEDARDHDDALFAERTDEGIRLVVAIADVSHYVRPGTAIDRAALERCTSIYLPDRAIPMLPPELSSHLASLVPNKDRLCMAVEMIFTKTGTVKRHRLMEGVMRSGGRLTYDGVARALGLSEEPPKQPAAEKRKKTLKILLELSRALRKKRMRRGSLDFDLPEPRVRLDKHDVEPVDVYRSRVDPGIREAYRIVEEMMLVTNEVVAAELKRRKVPAIYRIHGKPDERKIESFAQLATSLGYEMDPDKARTPKELAKFLRRIDGTEQADVLRWLLLRAMQQAVYDTTPDVGHFGLGADDYLHFTSPIRRYPDLAVHRVVRSILREEPIDAAVLKPKLQKQATESSRLERRAMVVERDVIDLYRAILMRDRVGEELEGRISSVESFGFKVTLDEPFVEVRIGVDALEDDYYEIDELGIRLVGSRLGRELALGDRIVIRLTEVDIAKRELRGVPASMESAPKRNRRRRSRKDRSDQGKRDDGKSTPKRKRTRTRKSRSSAEGGTKGQGGSDGQKKPKRRRTRRRK